MSSELIGATGEPLRSWVDENTGRRVWQMTNLPGGVALDYFRFFRHLPDGRMLINTGGLSWGNMGLLDPDSGFLEELPFSSRYLKLRPADGRIWFLERESNQLFTALVGTAEAPEPVATLPAGIVRHASDITCDGKTLILEHKQEEQVLAPEGTSELEALWMRFRRKRSGTLSAFDLESGMTRELAAIPDMCTFHVDTSPTDPGLVRYARDMLECTGQRMFMVRTDGTDARIIRPQEYGEMITHEFWWADPNFIGYTYQDRRGDSTVQELPWSEYAPVSTHLGIADLEGREVFRSDPLNSYHSHLYVSRCGNFVSGEGTDGTSFVFAAPFSWENTRVDMTALATIHTPYQPMVGQYVHADFSADSRWLLYNDTIDGQVQICRVAVDL